MKILLINQSPDNSKKLSTISISSYLLKAYVESNFSINDLQRISLKVLDFDYIITPSQMINTILAGSPDIVSFSVYLWNYRNFCLSSEKIKHLQPSIKTIFGGPQLASPEVAIDFMNKCSQADIVSYVNNSGEIIFRNILLSLLHDKDLQRVKGIAYRKNNVIKINSPPTQSIDLNLIPSPYIDKHIEIN